MIKLFETYKSQKELEYLTEIILEHIVEKTYENLDSMLSRIRVLESVKLNNFNANIFSDLKQFIIDYGELEVAILRNEDIDGHTFSNGDKATYLTTTEKDRYILIKSDKYLISQLNDHIKKYWDERDDYDGAMNSSLYSINSNYKNHLIHELQHAYDDWRSGGKATKYPVNFELNRVKDRELHNKGMENLKEEEIEFISNHYKEYLNIRTEVDARFTDSIQKTDFYEYDFDEMDIQNKDVFMMLPFDDVYKDFKQNIGNYRFLNDKQKKRVQQKFGKFYELEKEFVISKNNSSVDYDIKKKRGY